jgi:very-short-patch-repair endonuclease
VHNSAEEKAKVTKPKSSTLTNAKSLRSNQTEAEARLWYHLRAHRFMGLKFKRQKPVGRYIADFVCWERRLIIELDGGQHAEQVTYDGQRDAWLRSQGYTVLRFWNCPPTPNSTASPTSPSCAAPRMRKSWSSARALGYAALAITDECSLAGIVRALEAAKRPGSS